MSIGPKQMLELGKLAKQVDFGKLAKLSQKVDLGELMEVASNLDAGTLKTMMKMAKSDKKEKSLPEINGDFYDIASTFTPEQREFQMKIRKFMEEEVKPLVNENYQNDTFPRELFDKIRGMNLIDAVYTPEGERTEDAAIMEGIATMEMSRIDVSTAVGFGVHAGLAMGAIYVGGSEEQKAHWMPKMRNLETIAAFGLTEPKVGSGTAGGLTTTCRREGNTWVLNGQKKWIGNSTFADVVIIWAREKTVDKTHEDNGKVRGFIVETKNIGYSVEKIMGKTAMRMVENGLITLTDCKVTEDNRLQNIESFKDVAVVLRLTRAGVAWQGAGCAMGAYEIALKYAQERQQFGSAIGSFQLIQDKLVTILGNVTAMQTMCLRLSHMQDEGKMDDEHASLAKVFCAKRCRESVALARDLHGGNGILMEYDIARFFNDAEAIYSYEGTNEMNTLVVGKAITGFSAFV